MNPMFSIIIPCHNGEGCIAKCLDSVYSQVYKNQEVIVVCDACTDKTVEIVRKYPGIRMFEVDFHRDGLTRNVGLDHAQGEWVLFLDHDDWWLHEYVTTQLKDMTVKYPLMDLLYFSFIWKGAGYMSQSATGSFIAVWNKMWRKSFIGDTRFSDIKNWSDKDFNQAMNKKVGNRVFWDMPMYYYNFMYEGSINQRYAMGER